MTITDFSAFIFITVKISDIWFRNINPDSLSTRRALFTSLFPLYHNTIHYSFCKLHISEYNISVTQDKATELKRIDIKSTKQKRKKRSFFSFDNTIYTAGSIQSSTLEQGDPNSASRNLRI